MRGPYPGELRIRVIHFVCEKPINTYARYYRDPAASVYARYQIAGQGYGY
jgi:hypothetical protein